MSSFFRSLDRVVCGIVETLAIACLMAVAVACFYQVVTRFALDSPAVWTEMISRTLTIWCVYLGAFVLFRNGTLISVDMVLRKAGPRLRLFLDVLYLLSSLTVLSTACIYGALLAWRVRFQVMAGLGLPFSVGYAAIPVGAFLSIIAVLIGFRARHRHSPEIE